MNPHKLTSARVGLFGLLKKICIVFILCIGTSMYAQQENDTFLISNKESDFSQSLFNAAKGANIALKVSTSESFDLQINYRKGDVSDYSVMGSITNASFKKLEPGFSISKENGLVSGQIIFYEKKRAFAISTNNLGQILSKEVDINSVMCIDKLLVEEDVAQERDVSKDTFSKVQPQYESLPGATHVIYLDFDGEFVQNTSWANGGNINAQASSFSDQAILGIWRNMAEDFASYRVNVTTKRSVYNGAAVNQRIMCIFTPTKTAAPSAGGVAYLNSFNNNSDEPTWVFNTGERTAGETGSHEVGHTLGLRHDGKSGGTVYYAGHNGWAPIMGVSYAGVNEEVGHWSKGEYSGANNLEDDIAIISGTRNGFGFRADDHGNTTSNATALVSDASGNVAANSNKGLIEQRTDKDVFSFTTSGGNVEFSIDPYPYYPSLNIQARLFNSSGQQIASSNLSSFRASFNTSLSAGTYYIEVDGVGEGANATVGYTDYSSLGNFTISGKYPKGGTSDTQAPSTPTGLTSSNLQATSVSLSWNASTDNVGVTGYDVYQGNSVIATATSTSYNVSGLTENTAYQFRVKAKDAAGNASGFSNSVSVTTSNDTIDPTYCPSKGNSVSDEYISSVSLGSINNTTTGSSGGYGDYTAISTSLSKGASNTITITPTWTGTVYNEAYSVWIDYNNDGDFADSGEQVWSKAASRDTSVSGSFTVPNSASNGERRMRVSMKYNGIPGPCESFNYGEVEDYTVNIGGVVNPDPTCDDGIQNGDETGIDCGGSCAPCDTSGTVVYVDMADQMASSSATWSFFRIEIGDNKDYGAWFSGNMVRLVTYNKGVVCNGSTSNVTFLGEGVQVGASSNFVANPNSYIVSSSSYTDWHGKSGYIGFTFQIGGATHYGWFYVTVATNGLSYTIKDYAYNTTAGQGLVTKRPSTSASKTGNTTSRISAYPNPFRGTFTLNVSKLASDNFTVKVYNVLGKEIIAKRFTKNPGSISLGDGIKMSSGTYFVKVFTENQAETLQIASFN
ncbi:GEVED domain-containing protein [Aquimarina sp. 2201CG1-2-11]|uniref:GEVED domain-containing protein n=1 Tax=Aquimarina discodermiae TaxID=3231043 RepID=UPI0034626E11